MPNTAKLDTATDRAMRRNVTEALAEDIGEGDLTASLIDTDEIAGATIIARQMMVLAGQAWVEEIFQRLADTVVVDWYVADGEKAEPDDVLCKLVGPARALLRGERTALNFLQTLSAVATTTAKYVTKVEGTGTTILDTRKTIPGLRHAQKYAVTQGGGQNHRVGLFDAILIKENHIKSAGSIALALSKARDNDDDLIVEVEVESTDELHEALDAGATRILLDNFSIEELDLAVKIKSGYGDVAVELEASGDITLDNIRDVANTGVDYISIGALTKNVVAIDLSMQFLIG